MFDQEFIDLNGELHKHPELCAHLANHSTAELEIRLAEIASYCQVILDGEYDGRDLKKLAGILYKKLLEKRTGVLIVNGSVQ